MNDRCRIITRDEKIHAKKFKNLKIKFENFIFSFRNWFIENFNDERNKSHVRTNQWRNNIDK